MLGDDAIMIAYGAGKALDRADESLRKWMEACNERDQAIERQNNTIRQLMAEKASMDQQWTSDVRTLQKQLAETQRALESELMHAAGLEAQRTAYMEQHKDSPLLQDSGKRFRDGDVKTKARLIYEAAFDAKGREIGVENPDKRRED